MGLSVFHSRKIAVFAIFLVLFFLVNTSFSFAQVSPQKKADLLIKVGVDFYKGGEYSKAIDKFTQALDLASSRGSRLEIYLYLGLSYFGLGEQTSARQWIRKFVELDPEREASSVTDLCPPRFLDLFREVRSDVIESLETREEKPKVEEPRQVERKPAVATREADREERRGGGSSLPIILAILAIGGGVAAYFLLKAKKSEDGADTTGSITVTSTPTGAKVYLDGTDSGQTTNCTLSNVAPGSHTVRLTKDGYTDYSGSVAVTAGQTTTFNGTLGRNTIRVTKPTAASSWVKGQSVEISWEVGTSLASGRPGLLGRLDQVVNPGNQLLELQRMRALQARAAWGGVERRDTGPGGAAGLVSGNKARVEGRAGDRILSLTQGPGTSPGSTPSSPRPQSNFIPGSGAARSAFETGLPFTGASGKNPIKVLDISQVKIELYKGGSSVQTIADSAANSGTYSWTVSASLADGSDYKVRVSCASDTSVYGESAAFSVSAGVGKIRVTSTPTGATIYLDGSDTGKKTNNTLNAIAVGNHVVKVSKAGYQDQQKTVNVKNGLTANVSFTLKKYSITITQPTEDSIWEKGMNLEIKWTSPVSTKEMTSQDGKKDGIPAALALNQRLLAAGPTSTGRPGRQLLADEMTVKIPATVRSPGQVKADSPAADPGQGVQSLPGRDGALENVKIELFKQGTLVQTIADSTENDHSYIWTIDVGLEDSIEYTLRITAVDNPSVSGGTHTFCITRMNYIFDRAWGTGTPGNADGQFDNPGGIAVDMNYYVYVADTENHRIQKFSSSGSFIRKWGSGGPADGQFAYPYGIAVDSSNFVYVADYGHDRVQKFDSMGIFQMKWGTEGVAPGQMNGPHLLSADSSGLIYVPEYNNHRVQKFSPTGVSQAMWGSMGSGATQFNRPRATACDGSSVYVTDQYNYKVKKFTSSGAFILSWGAHGAGKGEFNTPNGIAVDKYGFVYVTDFTNNNIQKFTPVGEFVVKWGGGGSAYGQFNHPYGIAVDASGYIYVVDYDNHRVQKFKWSPPV